MRRTNEQLTALERYWLEAKDFVLRTSKDLKNPSWFAITREMPQHMDAWGRYYVNRFGFEPRGMSMLRDFKIESFLTPCEWPEWFDSKGANNAATRTEARTA